MGDFFVIIMKEKYRVKKSAEFQQIMHHKRYKHTSSFTLYIRKRIGENSRYGISVSKKMGNAPVRNKTKRQIRMMLQEIDCYDQQFDAVLLVRKPYFDKSYEENRNQLKDLLKTVKL